MANCIYCGKPVGFLRKHHVACRRQHDAAAAKIPGFFVKCLDSSLSGEKFHKLAVDVAKANYIGDRELRQLAIKGLSALANRVLTKTEDDRIAEIRKPFGLGPGDLGEAGRKLTKVEILRDLEEGRVPSSDRKLFSPRNLTILSAILLAAIVGWIAWPYYSVYELATALRDGDVSVLDNRVAWDSVRRGLRDDLNAIPVSRDANADPVFSGTVCIPRKDLAETMQKARRLRWDQVKYAFFSGGPLTFKVEWIAEHDLPFKNPTTLVFKWDGSWRLTRILCHKNLDKDKGGDSPPSTPVTLQEENLRIAITRNYSCPRIREFRHVGLDETGSVYIADCGNAIYQVFVDPKGVMTADFACGDGWQCGINSGY